MEDGVDSLGINISVDDLHRYSGISIPKILNDIQDGYLLSLIETASEEDSKKKILPLYQFDGPIVYSYFIDHAKDKLFGIDLLAYQERYGREKTSLLLEDMASLKEIIVASELTYQDDPPAFLKELLGRHGVKMKTYLRDRDLFKGSKMGFFLNYANRLSNHPKLCLYARDIAKSRLEVKGDEDSSVQDIFDELKTLSENKALCQECPHNKESDLHDLVKKELDEQFGNDTLTLCNAIHKNGLIVGSRDTLYHFAADSKNEIYAAKLPFNRWSSKCGYRISRKKPLKINEIHYGDHHIFDILCLAGCDKDGEPVIVRPWVTVELDAATSLPVGSVISINPNAATIMECYARASTIKVNNPAYGVPAVLYVDRGKDYRHYTGNPHPDKPLFLNAGIADESLIDLLGTEVRLARARNPQSKGDVERFFGTIENKYIRGMKGNISTRKRKNRYIRDINEYGRSLYERNALMTLEEFVEYYFQYVIPHYINTKVGKNPSPLEKYQTMERLDTVVPEWNSLAPYLYPRALIRNTPSGLRYRNKLYFHPKLLEDRYRGKKLTVFDQTSPLDNEIVVGYFDKSRGIGEYVCTAYQKEEIEVLEKNRFALDLQTQILLNQYSQMKKNIDVVFYLTSLNRLQSRTYKVYSPEANAVLSSYYADAPSTENKGQVAVGGVETLKVAEEFSRIKTESIRKLIEVQERAASLTKLINVITVVATKKK